MVRAMMGLPDLRIQRTVQLERQLRRPLGVVRPLHARYLDKPNRPLIVIADSPLAPGLIVRVIVLAAIGHPLAIAARRHASQHPRRSS